MRILCNHRDGSSFVRVDVAGHLRGLAAQRLESTLVETIEACSPDRLQVDLRSVVSIDIAGVHALVSGYATAIDYGTHYGVVNANPEVLLVLKATETLDLLTDSEDVAALLLAVLFRSAPPARGVI